MDMSLRVALGRTKKGSEDKFPPLEGELRELYLFRSADAFHEASLLALDRATKTKNEGQKFNLAVVYGVNGAFAVELYLKCLLAIELNQVPEIHDLQKLYFQLCRNSRAKLRRRHDDLAKDNEVLSMMQQKHGIKTDLESLLEDAKMSLNTTDICSKAFAVERKAWVFFWSCLDGSLETAFLICVQSGLPMNPHPQFIKS
jgi:HEPN domain-containing protein